MFRLVLNWFLFCLVWFFQPLFVVGAPFEEVPIPYTIQTSFDSYQVDSPPIDLPQIPTLLDRTPLIPLPELPDWRHYEKHSTGFSLFQSRAENLYDEAFKIIETNPIHASTLLDESLAADAKNQLKNKILFWKAQIKIRKGMSAEAEGLLWDVLASGVYSVHTLYSAHTLIWLQVHENLFFKAQQTLQSLESVVTEPLFKEMNAPLLVYMALKEKRYEEARVRIERIRVEAPTTPNLLPLITALAEIYYLKDDARQTENLVNDYGSVFYHDPAVGSLFVVGVLNQFKIGAWKKASYKIQQMIRHSGIEKQQWVHLQLYWYVFQGKTQEARQYLKQQLPREAGMPLLQDVILAFAQQKKFELVHLLLEDPSVRINPKEVFYLILGRLAELEAHPLQARENYQTALDNARTPQIVEQSHFHLGILFMQSGEWEKALEHFQSLTTQFQESSQLTDYFFWYGIALHESHQPNAIIALRQAQDHPKYLAESLFYLARLYQEQQQDTESIRTFLNLMASFPRHPLVGKSSFYLAKSYFQTQQYQASLDTLALISPTLDSVDRHEMLLLQSQDLRRLNRLEDLEDLLATKAVETLPWALLQLRLQALVERKKHEQIREITSLRLQTADLPNDEQKQLSEWGAQASWTLNDFPKVTAFYQQGLQQGLPASEEVRYRLAHAAYHTKQEPLFLEMAVGFIEEKSESEEHQEEILTLLGNYYLEQQKFTDAETAFKPLLQQYQQQAEEEPDPEEKIQFFLHIASIYQHLKQFQNAEIWLTTGEKRLPENSPERFPLWKAIASNLYQQQRYQQAIEYYLVSLTLSPQNQSEERFQSWSITAHCYQQLGFRSDALAIYQKMRGEFDSPSQQQQIQEWIEALAEK